MNTTAKKKNTTKIEVTDKLIADVATIILTDPEYSISGLSKALNLHHRVIRRVMEDPRFKEFMDKVMEEEFLPLVTKVRGDIYKLGTEAVRVIRENLKENSLDAAKLVMKVMALDTVEQKQQDTNLTVIMPGATTEQVIEVKDAIQDTEN